MFFTAFIGRRVYVLFFFHMKDGWYPAKVFDIGLGLQEPCEGSFDDHDRLNWENFNTSVCWPSEREIEDGLKGAGAALVVQPEPQEVMDSLMEDWDAPGIRREAASALRNLIRTMGVAEVKLQ